MNVLYLAAEATPLVKVGGLGDVAGELPAALAASGVNVRRCLPLYPGLERSGFAMQKVGSFEVLGRSGKALEAVIDGVSTLLIDGPAIRASSSIYEGPPSEGAKFVYFSLGALATCQALAWRPDVIHANDWHTAPALLRLRQVRVKHDFWKGVSGLLTIHNLGYHGLGAESALMDYDLLSEPLPALPPWAGALPLALGIAAADWLTTVSPTYAEEIQTEEYGHGLEGLLASRADRLRGILNGIDPEVWNPERDPSLQAPFNSRDLAPRRRNTDHLRERLGLPQSPTAPLLGMVTRLVPQKGIDLALRALEQLEQLPWQLVVLGSGDPELEREVRVFVDRHSDRAKARFEFDDPLARQIYGGADMLLIPSRYEPCGLAQMIAMRYGCVPIVRRTGGLSDTVPDYAMAGSKRLGFVFEPATPAALGKALRRALDTYADRRRWRGLQLRGMNQDHSWTRSAQAYRALYRQAIRDVNG